MGNYTDKELNDEVETFKQPFKRTTLGVKPKLDTFTVRVNDSERTMIEHAKRDLDINADSTVVKFLAKVGLNVLHKTFGTSELRYLFKKDRQRLSDYKDY